MSLRRTTIALPDGLLAAVDRLVRTGSAANRNQFIADVLEAELRRRERAAIDAEFARMADDPAYQAESSQLMRQFDTADRETWEALAKADR